ncbi:nitroreductase family protein [Humisphaera borealis]|uniref:Nitroreductase family protein n=1 Tax=Humisphaera borealis TaxID=2807512 RepID=A0A7M2WZL7_9BACT|nr:nitroreductase family protein [Humisphaera borealis]QOV90814.1 nitroreductase family protein [Humisphaera borealis]
MISPTSLDQFETLAKSRRATRQFRPDPVDSALLMRVIEIAHWAPSGYNLQPTHFTLVTEGARRKQLSVACMGQHSVADAPAVVVISGDRRVVENHFDAMLESERNAGSLKPAYEALLRKYVPLGFRRGPVGLNLLWKATLLPIVRLFRPIPEMPAVHMRFWLAKQTSLAAMNLMLAAEAAGLATLPMEGFDEARVRRVLGMPRSQVVTMVIAVGYPTDDPRSKTRLPVHTVLHQERW